MSPHSIESLPTEILSRVFSYVSEEEDKESPKACIKNVRLVSQRFKEVSSIFLIDRVTVRLSTSSLSRLEEICIHSDFRRSITHVIIDLSYYDTKLAQDINHFGESFGYEVSRQCDYVERGWCGTHDDAADDRCYKLWNIYNELRNLDHFKHDDSSATVFQRNLVALHKEYVRLTADQESLRLNNQHIRRLATALKNLPILKSITFSDSLASKYNQTWGYIIRGGKSLDDPEFFISALHPSGWNGTSVTAFTTSPPTEMLGELLSHFGNADIRPRSITMSLGVPVDLEILRLTPDQSAGIRRLVSKVSHVDLCFNEWGREGSHATDNDRSREEMLSLGSLTTALTSTSQLENLSVMLRSYPCLYQFPTANLSDLLPIKSVSWPELSRIVLDHLPCDLEDLVAFVDANRETLKSCIANSPYLRTGDWDKALDVLRGLKTLECFDLHMPQGGRYGDRWGDVPFPQEEAEGYVLGIVMKNPL